MLRKNLVLLLGALGCLCVLAACRPNQSLEGQAKDAQIKAKVKAKLASDVDATTLTSVEVNVTNGIVTLAGPVHSADERKRIASVARGVEGVAGVANALQVLAPERIVTPAGSAAASRPSTSKKS